MSKDFNAKMKLLIKSEKAMLDLEIRKKSRQTFWIGLALLAALVTLVLLNVTVYLYLAQTHTAGLCGCPGRYKPCDRPPLPLCLDASGECCGSKSHRRDP